MSRLDPNLSSEEVSNNGRGKEWPPIWKFGFSSFKVCGVGMDVKNSCTGCPKKNALSESSCKQQPRGDQIQDIFFFGTPCMLVIDPFVNQVRREEEWREEPEEICRLAFLSEKILHGWWMMN